MQEDPLGILKGSEDPLGILKKKDGGSVSQKPTQLQSSSKNILAQRPEELPLGAPKVGAAGIDRLFSAASEAKSKLDQAVSSRDDIYVDIIKENRLKELDRSPQAGLSDMVNPTMQSARRGIITQIPVKPNEIQSQKDVASSNPNAYREVLKRAAKKDPEVAKNAYLVDAEQRAMQKPESAEKILQNADKIASGELNYNVGNGVLQKPEGAFVSLYRGLQERNRQVEDYDFLTNTLNDGAIIAQLEDDRTRIDPDEPQPTPSGALAEFGMMAGMEGVAMTKSALAGLATGLVPGAQAAAPYVAAFASSPEYYQRGYSTALRSAYNEFRQRGDSEYEALQKAREQAETDANLSAAEGFASGFVGAKIGSKPTGFTVGNGFNNALKNTLVASKNFVTENLVEGGADAAIAGGLQIAKNVSAIEAGLDRGVFDGVQENVAGELAFSFGIGAIMKAGKLAINPKDLNTLVTGVARQPKEAVDAKIGEMVVTGQADPQEAVEAGKLIDEARKVDSQIPSTVSDEDTRVLIGEKIKERESLKSELATANEAFHKDIKDKIQNIDNEILSYATTESSKQVQEGAAESNIGEPTGAVQGQREGGIGEGIQREAEVPKADVGDSNLGSKVAPGKKLFNEPVPEVAVVEAEFKKSKGINTPEPAPITKLDEEKSKTIADAYDQLADSPNDPEVQRAYQAMADETMEQFGAIDKAGVKVEIWTGKGEPYKNSGEMIADVRDNKHMYIFSTEEGFGDTPITDEQRQQNALLRDSGIKDINGKPLLINDIFRFVHDYFGHSRLGNSFGAIGEENAWNVHARMYSPLARRAMTTETRGQNSWVNFNKGFRNPDGSMKKKGDEGYVPPAQRPFAEQKMALLPEEFSQIEDAYSVKPTVEEELTKELIKDPVAKVQESLKSAGITVDLIADPAEFDRQVQQLGGKAGMEGVFLAEDGKVLLNEQKLKEGTNAGRIIFHEATHPIINIIRNTNPELYRRVVNGINAASSNPAIQQAKAWVESNSAVYDTPLKQEDETIVETIAMVGDGTLDLDTIETGFKQALIEMINTIARALGFKPVLKDTDVAAFKKLAAQIADVLTSGRDVAEIVGKENVKEFQATGLQARAKDQLVEGAADLAKQTEAKTVDGNMQPSMILTAMKGGKESVVYSGPASIESMRELKPKMYISRAEELAQTHLFSGKKRMYSSSASMDQKLKWADDVYNKAKQTVVSNLLYIYDSIPQYIRDISKLWYDGANIIAQDMASKYGFTLEQTSAVIATQSPQKPWYDNVHLAQFIIDMYANKQDMTFSQEMFDYYASKANPSVTNKIGYPKQIEYLPVLAKSIGKPFSALSNYDKAAMVRADFDNNYERTAPLRIPTGIIVGRVDAPSSFSGYDTIAKGLSILENGSAENISANLGNAYKVRNFNNNIVNPRADDEVTIDTHAIAASYMLPLGSKSPEVKFDEATYAFFADAYREAAKQRGVLAREMQSITWEGARSLFPDTEKSANKKKAAQDLWNGYKSGDENINVAQEKIKENGKDLSVTDWSRFTDQLFEENRSPNYVEELPLSSRGRATAGLGDGGANIGGVPTMGEGSVQASAGGRLAPNGKPSNLTAKQYEQVRTPAFKNWFGDWENDPANASKVVDENGEPKVVYHGGPIFDSFRKGYVDKGIYFSDNKDFSRDVFATQAELIARDKANDYIGVPDSMLDSGQWDEEYFKYAKVYEVYLNIKNPKTVESVDAASIPNLYSNDIDGVIAKSTGDFGYSGGQYVVFEPNQIKSATANVGTFSTEDNRIQASVGNRPENNQNFKLAAFVMRKKAEGATEGEIAIGVASVTGMKPEDIKNIIDNPEQFIRDSFPSMSKLQQDNLIQKAKIQDIYRGRQFGKPIDKPFIGLEVPQEMVDDYLDKTGRADKNAKEWAKDFKRKWLDPAKGLPDWTLAIKDFASGSKNIEIARAANTIQRLKDTAKRIGFNDWDTFSKALVVAKDVNRFIPNESGIAPFDAYRAAANRTFATPDDQLPALVPEEIKNLPDEIIPFAYAMRGQIDNLTRDLIGSGYVSPEQAVTLEKNLGAYVNRSYKMFSERGYVPEKKVYNEAIKFLTDQKLPAIANDNVGVLTDKQIVEKAMEEAKKDVEAILNKKKNPYFGSKSDRRDTGILQERQDIPEPIRNLMGQYTDPGTTFIMTVAKQAALKSASQYLNKLRTMGMGDLFFEREDPSRPASYNVEIASKGSESMNPLGGLYTTKEIAEAIDMIEPTYNELTQAWMKLVGGVRWGKTVGSVATQFKNFESNGGFAVLNGYMLSGENTQAFKAAAKYVKGQYSKGEIDAITDKVIRLNLVGQSVGMRELKDMLGSGDVHDIALDIALNPEGKWGKRVAKRYNVFGAANKLYRLGDDFWKVYAYMVEREQLADARFNGAKYDSLSKQQQDQIDLESSERVKNTWPTYDRVVEGAKFVSKRAPIFGNFISFQAESLRALANSVKLAYQDLSDPQLRHLGVRRMVGISAYFGLRSAITIGVSKMAGFAAAGILGSIFGDDEEERNKRALREALPTFMRTGDLAAVKGDKPHLYTVVDMSSLDPYGVIPRSLNAFTEGREGIFGRTMEPGVLAAGTEFFSGFLEPEMTFETMWSIRNNINPKTGEQLIMETDTDLQASAKIAAAVWDQLEPSTAAMIERLFERENKSAELLALGGARPYEVDLHKSFGFVLSRFGKDIDAINREYNGIKYNDKMTAQDKEAAEKVAEDKKAFAISKVSQVYRDFINIGADPKVLDELINQKSAVKVTGYDKNTKKFIKTGKINKEKLFK